MSPRFLISLEIRYVIFSMKKKKMYIQFTTTRNRIREKRYSNRIERNLITRGGKVYFNPLFILIAEKSNAKHSYTGISIEKLPLIRLCIFERFDDYSHESYPSPGKEEALIIQYRAEPPPREL